MAQPPISPIKLSEDKSCTYFELLARKVMPILKEDGIPLTFEGYSQTLIDYREMKLENTKIAWEIARDLNAWSDYFSELANLIQKLYLDSETIKNEIISLSSIESDATKVANGNRLANKDKRVVNARMRRNLLKAFHSELESKVEFLKRGHYHAKATSEGVIYIQDN